MKDMNLIWHDPFKDWSDEPSWEVTKKDADGRPMMVMSTNGDVLKYIYQDGKLVGFEGARHPKKKN